MYGKAVLISGALLFAPSLALAATTVPLPRTACPLTTGAQKSNCGQSIHCNFNKPMLHLSPGCSLPPRPILCVPNPSTGRLCRQGIIPGQGCRPTPGTACPGVATPGAPPGKVLTYQPMMGFPCGHYGQQNRQVVCPDQNRSDHNETFTLLLILISLAALIFFVLIARSRYANPRRPEIGRASCRERV